MSELSPEPTADDGLTDFFRPGATSRVPLSGASIAEGTGDVIGHYKLLQQIGEGGMGVVFMAEQTSPVHRTVALKIIKPGMDSRQVIARFEAERQALALMEHPNIARVLDAGATASGRPYFVMELVKGVAITDYCDEHHLTPRERLELFLPVCQAVQHAHQKGIIHRDIKPTNVMVAEYDSQAVPKIIDFGVAKATAQRLTERTMFTEFGQVLGTVEYMSPEQAKLNQLDIDTRTDVYSLGVLLYELLTGQTPFDRQRLHSAAFDEMLRIIREEEPPKPSTKLSGSAGLVSIAANRRVEPQKLARLVRGELDWIVMKALEKDRNRRYETANGFARDLERYLADEPVQACPPSAAYRFHKLARRNKAALVTAAIVAVSLVMGTVVSIWQATLAHRAESLAETRLVAEQAARQQAAAEAAKATAINDLLQQMLQSANPDAARGADYTVRQMLDDFSARFGDQLHDQPEAEATIHATIGNAYQRMGALNRAESHLAAALKLRQRVFGDNHVQVADSLVDYARLKSEQGRAESAMSLAKEALAIHRHLKLPEEQTIKVLDEIALQLWAIGPWDELEPVIDEIRAIAAKNPDKYPEVANLLHRLAETIEDPVVGEQYAREAVALHRRLHGETHPETGWGLQALALTLRKQGKLADAERAYREALEVFRKHYAEFDAPVVLTMKNLAMVLRMKGDEPGLDQLRQWAETLATADGPDHEAWLYGGEFFAELGQWDRAERFIAKSMLSPGLSARKAGNLARIQLARQQEAEKARSAAGNDDEHPNSKDERQE